jgi:hypothetical protein
MRRDLLKKIGRGRSAAPGPRAERQPSKPNSAPRRLRRDAGVRCTLLRRVVRICAVSNLGGACSSRHEGRFTTRRTASLGSFHATPMS